MSPPFAETDPVALLGAVGSLCTVLGGTVGGGVVWLLNRRDRRRKDAIGEYQQIIAQLQADMDRMKADHREAEARRQAEMDRLKAHDDEQQRVINRLAEMHGDCRQENAEMYALAAIQNSMLKRWAVLMRAKDIAVSPDEIPDMPPRPGRGHESEAEFLKRTTAQNMAALVPPRTTGGADAGAAGRRQPDHPDQPH